MTPGAAVDVRFGSTVMPSGQTVLEGLVLTPPPAAPSVPGGTTSALTLPGNVRYNLKIPGLSFKTERMPIGTEALVACIGATVAIGDKEIAAGMRAKTAVVRREEEIFSRTVNDTAYQAQLSEAEIARRAQRVLFEPEYLDPRELHTVLLKRLETE